MKRGLFVLLALVAIGVVTGCAQYPTACDGGDPGIQNCGRFAHCWPPCGAFPGGHGRAAPAAQPQQPPVAAVTYPYYTLRGPRDFLQTVPSPCIGP